MGKDLKGKELGVGICQTKDKKYVARITTRNGKRVKRVFDKLVDCRTWIAEARYNEEHARSRFFLLSLAYLIFSMRLSIICSK